MPTRWPRSAGSWRNCRSRSPPRQRHVSSLVSRAWTTSDTDRPSDPSMTAHGHEGITGVTFRSDGNRLVGVLYLAQGNAPKPTLLLLHGCPGLEQNSDIAIALRDRGWNSLVFHYRGCWGSAGRYDLRTVPEDVRPAADHLQQAGYPGVDPDRLAVVGHSLGGWAAVLAAAADERL